VTRVQTNLLEHVQDPLPGLGPAETEVPAENLLDRRRHGLMRVERSIGILKDHLCLTGLTLAFPGAQAPAESRLAFEQHSP
jgi:hypothetical protein